MILISETMDASQNALLVNDVLLTVNGFKLLGSSTTLLKYPASRYIFFRLGIYFLSTLLLITIWVAFISLAT